MKLGLIGAGNMASALARGIGEPLLVTDIDGAKARALADELGGEAVGSNAELAQRSDAVVLCHKPKQLAEVAAEVAGHTDTVISILAATSTASLADAYHGAAIYRFIPNMPVEVRRGVLCYVAGPGADAGPEAEILELMGRVGEVIRLDDEPLIEPAMALMSCGPAFMALVAESFADAGAAHGLDPDNALRMVVETMGGTADYLARHGYDAAGLRTRVATPGGTTEQGLIRLEDEGLRRVVRAAVDGVVEATR
jgi:pyrroline-5-carboxylate reductase